MALSRLRAITLPQSRLWKSSDHTSGMCQARTGLLHVTRYTAIDEVDVDGGQLVRLGACDASRMDPECAPAYEAEHCARRKWHREPAGLHVYKLADAEIVSIAGGEIRIVRNKKSCRLSAFTEMLHTRSLDSGLSLALIGNGPIIGDFQCNVGQSATTSASRA